MFPTVILQTTLCAVVAANWWNLIWETPIVSQIIAALNVMTIINLNLFLCQVVASRSRRKVNQVRSQVIKELILWKRILWIYWINHEQRSDRWFIFYVLSIYFFLAACQFQVDIYVFSNCHKLNVMVFFYACYVMIWIKWIIKTNFLFLLLRIFLGTPVYI